MTIGSYAFGGIPLESLVRDTLHGPDISGWLWVLVLQAVASTLGYFKLDLSARILTVLLVAEGRHRAGLRRRPGGGADGLGLQSFTPTAAFSGSVGIALLFGLTCSAASRPRPSSVTRCGARTGPSRGRPTWSWPS
jgi:hypothetical protein